MARRLGWDTNRRDDELAAVRTRFADELSFTSGEDPAP